MSPPPPRVLVEGVDYYREDGRWVFTEKFLRDRGYCCKSGCRHCPYGFVKEGAKEGEQGASAP
jgi:hypothetical protein